MNTIINNLNTQTLLSLTVMGMRGSSLIVKFLLTLFIAKFMGFEALGIYGLILSVTIISRIVLGLSLMHTISRNAVTQTYEEICEALTYYFRYTFLVYIVSLCISVICGYVVDEMMLALLIAFIMFFEHLASDLYVLLLNLSKPFMANFLHFIRSAVWMIFFMVLAFLVPSIRELEVLLALWLLGCLLSLIGFSYLARNWPWEAKSKKVSLKSWLFSEFSGSRTMYFTSCMTTMSAYWNHFLITLLLGLELTGVYVYFMQLLSALSNLVQTGVIQIARPKLVRLHKENSLDYISLYKGVMVRTMITTLLLGVTSGYAFLHITLFLDKKLAIEWLYILWPILFLFVLSMASEVNKLVFYSMYRDNIIFRLSAVMIVLTVSLNSIFVPLLGLWGAVIAPIVVGFLAITMQYIYIQRLFGQKNK